MLLIAASPAYAGDAAPGPGLYGILKILVSLALVLVTVVGIAWFTRHLSHMQHTAGLIRVRGGASLGARERVVIVEIDKTWLVLGVAPGRINVLHTLSSPADTALPADAGAHRPTFSSWLKNAIVRCDHA